jgi:hypothetical protein
MQTDTINLFRGKIVHVHLLFPIIGLELVHVDLHTLLGLGTDNSIETILLRGLTTNRRKQIRRLTHFLSIVYFFFISFISTHLKI